MTEPDRRLTDPLPSELAPGLYRLHSSLAVPAIVARFARDHWATSVIELDGAVDKPGIMEAFARGLDFPGWVGRNWDALDDALRDLSWWPPAERGRLLLVRGVGDVSPAHPGELRMLEDVLETAVASWAGTDSPLVVLLQQ
jgi:hypothetical protein